jgi:hypothetical protein
MGEGTSPELGCPYRSDGSAVTTVPPPPEEVEPIAGWVTGGAGICEQVWEHETTEEPVAGGGHIRYTQCGRVASVPVLVNHEPHLVCTGCYPDVLELPNAEPWPGLEPPGYIIEHA